MRSIRYHQAGEPSVLRLDDVDRPSPGPDEVLIDVRAASINPTDAKRRMRGTGPLPKTTGSDVAGVVESIGSDIARFSPGDRVCGTGLHTARFQQGSFADYVAVPTDVLAPLPDGVSFEQAAAVALVGVTAWRALVDHADLEPGETCLVHGGTGGVGHVAVQLAAVHNAVTVATVGSSNAREAAEGFGADAVVRYDSETLLEDVLEAAGREFDVVLDHRVHDYFAFDMDAAAFGGRIVHYGGLDGAVTNSRVAMQKDLTIKPMTMSNLASRPETPRIADVLPRVLGLVGDGLLVPEIAATYDLEEAVEVHRSIMEDSFVGKLVVTP
ncbi:quinone oxidoreductase family protein [Natronorubrum sp. FCH18a]|uniref:quinone oxidoreductase family protein n=1 Tax=Natronorubrum sp. FCH18a TaxID=3447018 RepID=UPI003F512DED